MSSITRHMNIVSRCAGLYRAERLKDSDLGQNHHRYIFCICRHPGISQEELSRRVYINKSNVTRHLTYLESKGYVERRQSEEDKRVTLVFPTEKAYDALPLLREIVHEWNEMLTEEFTPEEKELFASLIERAAKKASDLIGDEALEE